MHSFGRDARGGQLPSYADGYSKLHKPKRAQGWKQLQSSPILRLLVVILALAGLAFTLTSRSGAPDDYVPRRQALEQEGEDGQFKIGGLEGGPEGGGSGQPLPPRTQREEHQEEQHRWAQRRVTTVHHERAGEFHDGAATAEREEFNPAWHQMYLELPPLREPTPAIFTGSWQLNKAVYDYAATHPAAQVLSWEKPRVVLFKHFLSPDEVQHLVDVSTPLMSRSEVLTDASKDGNTGVDSSRTSYGAWPAQDDVLKGITARIHRLVAIPEQFGEGVYVLRYQLMQQYQGHSDNCMGTGYSGDIADKPCMEFLQRAGGPDCGPGAGGPSCGDRIATFILYLKHPTAGGATVFPSAEVTKKRMAAAGKELGGDQEWYCKEEEVLAANPSAGDAVLFWDYMPGRGAGNGSYRNGTADPSAQGVPEALHSGCPVLSGEKWIATRWIRGAGFDYPRT